MPRNDYGMNTGSFRRSQASSEIVRILDAIEDEEKWLLAFRVLKEIAEGFFRKARDFLYPTGVHVGPCSRVPSSGSRSALSCHDRIVPL